ncbi:MAG TPA: cytochrome c-type biogenesis protein CcmH [Anaerolineales bacterium]|nr:cytochrome c-type biogenesis protein CcmH [Anaerolineales bacterium]
MRRTSIHKAQKSKTPWRYAFYVLVALLLGILFSYRTYRSASAQQPAPTPSDNQVNQIAHQLYCPVCANTPLDVCPTDACRQWRDLIRQQLSQGWTETQIKQYFVQQYGVRVLAEPPQTGFDWLIYVLPPVIILIGAFILFRALRMWTKPAPAGGGDGGEGNAAKDEYVARLEEELQKRN